MRVFISWSGGRSRAIAGALRDWLPAAVPGVEPWFSGEDIEAGAPWNEEILKALNETRVAVACVTPENLESAPIAFEAGASLTSGSTGTCGGAISCVARVPQPS